jgi:Tol biopolymer transport system component
MLGTDVKVHALASAMEIAIGASGPAWAHGITERLSVSSSGRQGNDTSRQGAISADGRFVAFVSASTNLVSGDTNGTTDVFVRDGKKGTTARLSVGLGGVQGNGGCDFPSISADGRSVAFESEATNLVLGDTNGESDVFVRTLLP